MRKRGVVLFLAGAPALAYTFYVFYEVHKTPVGSEFGSIAFPIPAYLRAIGVFGVLSTLIGLVLAVWDLGRWLGTR